MVGGAAEVLPPFSPATSKIPTPSITRLLLFCFSGDGATAPGQLDSRW
jgi:hypothetical protein